MKMEQTECFETSAYKIQTPGNYPEGKIQHTEHGKSLKSRIGVLNTSSRKEIIHAEVYTLVVFYLNDFKIIQFACSFLVHTNMFPTKCIIVFDVPTFGHELQSSSRRYNT
jgi:hypothetical protein